MSDAHSRASRAMISAGFGKASHVLCMFGECIDFQRSARECGRVTLVDVNVAPSSEAIVRREQSLFPDWEPPSIYFGETLTRDVNIPSLMETVLATTDRFLCPSEFVRDDLINNYGVDPGSTRLVPYAVNPKWFDVKPTPETGRILFAGGAGIRKGIHRFAEAARILQSRGRNYRFIVAGTAPGSIRERPEVTCLEFLGRLPPADLQEQYARADLLALPSLAEGSAGVTYEALGCALPVVTTHETGSVVRHGIEGLVVPSRDAEALAHAIDTIVMDREVRERMSVSARARARQFSWEHYANRLTASVFSDVPPDKEAVGT